MTLQPTESDWRGWIALGFLAVDALIHTIELLQGHGFVKNDLDTVLMIIAAFYFGAKTKG